MPRIPDEARARFIYRASAFASVKCSLTLTLEFRDESIARNVMHAVRLDNGEWISTRQEGNRLHCTAASDTLGGLLHTAEDFLSCVSLAERMQKKEK